MDTALRPDLNAQIDNRKVICVSWLAAVAYKYRRLRGCFAVYKCWKEYNVFFRGKASTG